jgi:hypothetical protein
MWQPFAAANPQAIGQQTLVGRIIGSGMTAGRAANGNGTRRRRKASRKTAPRRAAASPAKYASRRKSASAGRPARLVKGSAAAKAYMAKIRRKRGK